MERSAGIAVGLVPEWVRQLDEIEDHALLMWNEANPEVMAATHVTGGSIARGEATEPGKTHSDAAPGRKRASVSLAQLEERSGITRSTLSKLWNDPDPNATLTTIERITDAMGVIVCVTLSK